MSASLSATDDVPLLLSVSEAAKKSGVSRSELYRWIEDGRLPARQIGSKWRILWADLVAAIDALPRVGG